LARYEFSLEKLRNAFPELLNSQYGKTLSPKTPDHKGVVTDLPKKDLSTDWKITGVGYTPKNFWKNRANQRRYMEELAIRKLNFPFSDFPKWYDVTASDLKLNSGNSLLKLYKNSLYLILKELFPEFKFEPWRFSVTPRSILKDKAVFSDVVGFVERRLKMDHPAEQWQRVNDATLKELGVFQFFKVRGGRLAALSTLKNPPR